MKISVNCLILQHLSALPETNTTFLSPCVSLCVFPHFCSLCVFYSRQYCHYVAGLVGVGLSKLFSASKLEDPEVGQDTELANSMGLFLQKTNIIRDYLEDTQEGRAFWPQEASLHSGGKYYLHFCSKLHNSACTIETKHTVLHPCILKYLPMRYQQNVTEKKG